MQINRPHHCKANFKTVAPPNAELLIDGAVMLQSAARQVFIAIMLTTSALAASPSEQRGRTFALNNCARCHSIDKVTKSPLKIAPPFRTLHKRYPVESSRGGVRGRHPDRTSDDAGVSA